eukprot:345873-Chlamydomonas_euryale.AAC.1
MRVWIRPARRVWIRPARRACQEERQLPSRLRSLCPGHVCASIAEPSGQDWTKPQSCAQPGSPPQAPVDELQLARPRRHVYRCVSPCSNRGGGSIARVCAQRWCNPHKLTRSGVAANLPSNGQAVSATAARLASAALATHPSGLGTAAAAAAFANGTCVCNAHTSPGWPALRWRRAKAGWGLLLLLLWPMGPA